MNDRQKRIYLLSRMNRGSRMKAQFLSNLSAALGVPVTSDQLLDLPESDLVLESIRRGLRSTRDAGTPSYKRYFSISEADKLATFIEATTEILDSEKIIFWLRGSDYCGAVRSTAGIVLKKFKEIIDLDRDSVLLITEDKSQGIIVDFNFDAVDDAYEVAVWGDRWPLMILPSAPPANQ